MTKGQKRGKYADRGEEKVSVGWIVPVRIRNVVRIISNSSGRSQSAVASELLDQAINRHHEPTKSAE